MKHLASYFPAQKTLIIFFGCIFTFAFSSCNNEETYADQLQQEKELINNYIRRNNIEIISTVPASDVAWNEHEYINPQSNMYFNLQKPGIGTDTIESGDIVTVRFKSYSLDENPDSILNWTTVQYPYPPTFTYQYIPKQSTSAPAEACRAWHIALSYMKKSESEAKIIVPSKMGFTALTANPYWGTVDDETTATPRVYILRLQFRK